VASQQLELALERMERALAVKREAAQSERAAAWGRIQREAPDLAELLGEVNRAFGKPAAVRVTINGERVI